MTIEEIQKCKAQIKRHEGLRLEKYADSLGNATIGYGHLVIEKDMPDRITIEDAEELFDRDFLTALKDGKSAVTIDGNWNYLNAPRQAVLVDMAFNLGLAKLLEFKNTLNFIALEKYDKAADAMLASRWAKQVGKRAIELSQQIRTGVWQNV
jgi:lysozyme